MVYKFILLNILDTGAVSALVSDVKAFFLHYMYTNQMYSTSFALLLAYTAVHNFKKEMLKIFT
jgi:hypothetical protein